MLIFFFAHPITMFVVYYAWIFLGIVAGCWKLTAITQVVPCIEMTGSVLTEILTDLVVRSV